MSRYVHALLIALLATVAGCKKQTVKPDPSPDDTAKAPDGAAEKPLPPPFETNPPRLADDPGLYETPAELFHEDLGKKAFPASSEEYAIFLAPDGEWIGLELDGPTVLARGTIDGRRVMLKGLVGSIARIRVDNDPVRGLDVRSGEWVDAPDVSRPEKEIVSDSRGGEPQCGRTAEGKFLWTIPCRGEMKRRGDVVVSWDHYRSPMVAHSWETGEQIWEFDPDHRPKNWTFVAFTDELVWMDFTGVHHDLFLGIDLETGELREALQFGPNIGLTKPSRLDRVPYAFDGTVGVIDLTNPRPPRRLEVPLEQDVDRWIEEAADAEGLDWVRVRGHLSAVAHGYPELVIDRLLQASDVFRRLAADLPAEMVNPHAEAILDGASGQQLAELALPEEAGYEPFLKKGLRRTFGQAPTAEWIEARHRFTEALLGRGPGYDGTTVAQTRIDDELLDLLVEETARWVTEAPAATEESNRDVVVNPPLANLVDDVVRLVAVATTTAGLRTPLVEAVRQRERLPICPYYRTPEQDEGPIDCGFAEPPAHTAKDGENRVAAWYTEEDGVFGQLVVARRVDGAWSGPWFTGLRLSGGQFVGSDDTSGSLRVRPTKDGVTVSSDVQEEETLTWAKLTRDSDDDGWTDGLERILGSNPKRADSDGDGSADPDDPMIGCARTHASTAEQRLWRDAAVQRFVGRGETAPLRLVADPKQCVEVPTLGGPIILVDQAFVDRSLADLRSREANLWRIEPGEAAPAGDELDRLQSETFERWYVATPEWRQGTLRRIQWGRWTGVGSPWRTKEHSFVEVADQWRPVHGGR